MADGIGGVRVVASARMVVASTIYHFVFSQMEYMGLLDCELLDRSVGLAESDVIFKSRTLDYMTPTCDGEKKTQTTHTTTHRSLSFFCSFCDGVSGSASEDWSRNHAHAE